LFRGEGWVPVWTYWLIVLCALIAIALGFAMSGEAGFCSGAVSQAVSDKQASSCLEFWLNRYQTLIGALVAVFAAFVGWSAVRSQMRQTERIEEEKLKRSNLAARGTMPLALNAISEYAEECIRIFEAHRVARSRSASSAPPPSGLPAFPESAIEPLRRTVEFSAYEQARRITDLLATAQVFLARTRDGSWAAHPSSQLQDRMLDAVDLYSRASFLFEYARSGTMDRHLVTAENIRSALHIHRIDLADWPLVETRLRLLQAAAARHESAGREGNADRSGNGG
jgi:hypothetical protein